ncbi:Uncharacterised protein [Aedoeadaptatus ivorii]|uniref:Putative Se/S carrier protein-like domain-containing protein n=1 Tax=Aedoeadaptatus ivorii TaxID=54006 RepID=A0A3S4Z431_9FIRM|nr:putative Se/S carrier-like protein [Peptoniphilus ivorii]MDQ0508164.1 hypothetical protein [Peptoniphilus ivorii]VEJ35894.1 Uncharacterised protein [Peptoniphilus ivorii]
MEQFVIAFDGQEQVYDALDATEDLGTRIIPVLPEIKESCGLALSGPIERAEEALSRIESHDIPTAGAFRYERIGKQRKVEEL